MIGVARSAKEKTGNIYMLASFLFWGGVLAFDGLFSVFVISRAHWPLALSYVPASVMHLSIGIFELPTGAMGDVFGRLRVARWGFWIVGLSLVSLGVLPMVGVLQYLVPIGFSVIFAFGWTLTTGTFSGWFYEAVLKGRDGKEISQFYAKLGFITNCAILGFSILYSRLVDGHLSLAWLISGGAVFCCLGISFIFDEVQPFENLGFRSSISLVFEKSLIAIKYFFENKPLYFLVMIGGCYYAATAVFSNSVLFQIAQLKASTVIADRTRLFFWPVAISFNLIFSYVARFFTSVRFFSSGRAYFSSVLFSILLLLGYAALSCLTKNPVIHSLEVYIAVYIGMRVFVTLSSPWISGEINRLIKLENIRATVLSINSLILETGVGGIGVVFSFFLPKNSSLELLWFSGAGISLLGFVIFFILYLRLAGELCD